MVAEVTVDARTGSVSVTHGWIAAAAGEIIDPDGLTNQLEGGFVQATSWTLEEQVDLSGSGDGGDGGTTPMRPAGRATGTVIPSCGSARRPTSRPG